MIKYHNDLIQGSEDWHAARCGLLTASEMKLIITPTLKMAANDKTRAHLWELAAQRITKYVEPQYVSNDMLRGHDDEIEARGLYVKHHAEVADCGFITNDRWGFTIGCSPDGLVGKDGVIECKSRCQKYQMQTICTAEMPDDYLIQVQTILLVSERVWCDFISYSGGMPLFVQRVFADDKVQEAIVRAATEFEDRLADTLRCYEAEVKTRALIPTERRIVQEMFA